MVVTCGDQGMVLSDPEIIWVPAVRVTGPVDPTGAGDSATAGAVLALAAGPACRGRLGRQPGGFHHGSATATTGTASREQLPAQLLLWLNQQQGKPSSPGIN